MAIEAPLSKFKRNTLIIWITVCIGFAAYCAYDGYLNDNFTKKHTDAEGNPDSTLAFNRKSPPVFIAAAVLLGIYLAAIKNKKIIADEKQLNICDKEKIPYDSIEKINKTHFDSKGFFVITYKKNDGTEVDKKLSDKNYDNLAAVLEKLAAEIS